MTAHGRFPRGARLLKPDEFEKTFEQGRRHPAKFLSAVVANSSAQAGARLGLTVSKKTAARACDRNRLKRHIRESFRRNLQRLPAVDVVISARPGSAKASAAELRANLDHLWTRIAQACAVS